MSKEKNTLFLHVEMDKDQVLEALAELPQDDLLALIKELDERQQNWDFTEALYAHFDKLHDDYLKESK